LHCYFYSIFSQVDDHPRTFGTYKLNKVIISPLLIGFVFGPKMLAGFLPGAIVSAVQLATSAANTGGAWDNAKKYIEGGHLSENGVIVKKGS
jgi:Na+/H+-translocating membrane pyrophosphatase